MNNNVEKVIKETDELLLRTERLLERVNNQEPR